MSDRWRDDSEYRVFLMRERELFGKNLKEVAEAMGKSERWLYSVIDGTVNLIPDDIVLFANITGERRFVEWFTQRVKGLTLRDAAPGELDGDVYDNLEGALDRVNALFGEYRKARKDGKVGELEMIRLLDIVQQLRDEADTIEAELTHSHGGMK